MQYKVLHFSARFPIFTAAIFVALKLTKVKFRSPAGLQEAPQKPPRTPQGNPQEKTRGTSPLGTKVYPRVLCRTILVEVPSRLGKAEAYLNGSGTDSSSTVPETAKAADGKRPRRERQAAHNTYTRPAQLCDCFECLTCLLLLSSQAPGKVGYSKHTCALALNFVLNMC